MPYTDHDSGLLGDNAVRSVDRGRGPGTPALETYMKHGKARLVEPRGNSLESVMTSLGKSRDLDGSVDRVGDPPDELLPTLYSIQQSASVASIDLYSIFVDAGSSPNGTISPNRFNTALKDYIRHHLTRTDFALINQCYGVGYRHGRGEFEQIAWKDFCEDVGRVATGVSPDPPFFLG